MKNIHLQICWKTSNDFPNCFYQLTTAKAKNSPCSTSSTIFVIINHFLLQGPYSTQESFQNFSRITFSLLPLQWMTLPSEYSNTWSKPQAQIPLIPALRHLNFASSVSYAKSTLICISLITNRMAHLFLSVLVISAFPFIKCLTLPFAWFSTLESAEYIYSFFCFNNSLCQLYVVAIISHTRTSIFSVFIASFGEEKFLILMQAFLYNLQSLSVLRNPEDIKMCCINF